MNQPKFGVHSRSPVGAPARGVDGADAPAQFCVFAGPLRYPAPSPLRRSRLSRRPAHGTRSPHGDAPSPARRTRTPLPAPAGLPSEEGGGFFRIARSSRRIRFSRRSRFSSSRSAVVHPGRCPASMSAWRTHFRRRASETPRLAAICWSFFPLSRTRRTASARNSGGYGGLVAGMGITLSGAYALSIGVSTKAG